MIDKKQTAVEWLVYQILNNKGARVISTSTFYIKDEIINQAKEIEKQQKDDYDIEFAQWVQFHSELWMKYRTSELLEIFKKEKGL